MREKGDGIRKEQGPSTKHHELLPRGASAGVLGTRLWAQVGTVYAGRARGRDLRPVGSWQVPSCTPGERSLIIFLRDREGSAWTLPPFNLALVQSRWQK